MAAAKRIYTRGTPVERAIERIVLDRNNCWLWDGAKTPAGYGHINCGGGIYRHAHRVLYEHFRGDLTAGLEIDHLCRVRGCVNPWHLEEVTHIENVRRGASPTVRLHLAGTCKRGHPVTEETHYVSPRGKRNCRVCRRIRRAAGVAL